MNKNTLFASGILAITLLAVSSFTLTTKVDAYGLSPAGASTCNSLVPGTPSISSVKALGGGSVELSWNGTSNATSWTVAFGTQPGKYIYGAPGFGDGNTRSIKINSLQNKNYYFVLRANNSCMPGAFSQEKSILSSGTSSSKPIIFTTVGTGTPAPVVTPAPVTQAPAGLTNGFLVPTPSPLVFPTATPAPQGETSFWQSILNFFNGLFGK